MATVTDPETGALHNPAFTRMMRARGFKITNMGGNIAAYRKSDRTVGEVIVSHGEGWLPTRERDGVTVSFFGFQHTEPMLVQHFPSLRAFVATVGVSR